MNATFSPQQLDLRRAMGNPKPPTQILQEPFEADDRHLTSLARTEPGTTAAPNDLYEYVQDVLYTKIDPVLLRYVLPFCLDEWRRELRENAYGHGGMIEHLYPLLAKPEVFETHLLPEQTRAVSEFMWNAILEEINDQRGLHYESAQARPYRWIRALTSYGVLRPDIHLLWNEWWSLKTIGRSVAFLQYVSSLMYAENENPIFAPWTPNGGGGPPNLSEFAGHMYKHRWLPANVEFLRSRLATNVIEKNLHKAVQTLQSESEHSVAAEMETDWPLCVDLFERNCAKLCLDLATKE